MRSFVTAFFILFYQSLAFAEPATQPPNERQQVSENYRLQEFVPAPLPLAHPSQPPAPAVAPPVSDPEITWKTDLMWMNF